MTEEFVGTAEEKESILKKIAKINPILQNLREINADIKMKLGFFNASDEFPLFYRLWHPSRIKHPKKIVICIHGLHSHGEKFVFLADTFSKHNWFTYAIDLRGHGLSWDIPDNKGDIPDFEYWINDLDEFVNHISEKYPNIPIYVIGESMGEAAAIHLAGLNLPIIKALVLISPGIKPWKEIEFGMITEAFLYSLLVSPDKEVIQNKSSHKLASNSDDIIEYQMTDPLRLPKLSPRYYYQVIKMIHNLKNVNIEGLVPTCVFYGGKDYLVSFDAIQTFIGLLKDSNKALHFIPNAYHDLLTDKEAKAYGLNEKIRQWIKNR